MVKHLGTFLLLIGLSSPSSAVKLECRLDSEAVLSGPSQTAYLRVALTGPEITEHERSPVNLGLIIDRSGSMQGDKIVQARSAALNMISRLRPDDVVSVIIYDNTVRVLAPARRLRDQPRLAEAIASIKIGGDTALFAGLAKGGYEVRKFIGPGRVHRLVLLSDGLANVGPSSPGELAELGASLGSEGIAVTTIGLGTGYNEVLMDRLARSSDGNHFFAEKADDLKTVFAQELGEMLSVVATDVTVQIELAPGVHLKRTLGRPVHLMENTAEANLLQLYSRQTKYLLLELELPPGATDTISEVARVEVEYTDLGGIAVRLADGVQVRHTHRIEEIEASKNAKVLSSVARQLGALRNQTAMQLRDDGRIDEARQMLLENAAILERNARLFDNRWLAKDAFRNRDDADSLGEEDWDSQRKEMTQQQFEALRSLGYIE